MREIKVKGWNTVEKIMYSVEELTKDQLTLIPNGEGFINVNGTSTRFSKLYKHILPLQYIGFSDMRGKEIYVGDIIQSEDKLRKWSVEYSIAEGGRYIGKGLGRTWNNNLPPFSDLEVIGNIYENPEFLEKK